MPVVVLEIISVALLLDHMTFTYHLDPPSLDGSMANPPGGSLVINVRFQLLYPRLMIPDSSHISMKISCIFLFYPYHVVYASAKKHAPLHVARKQVGDIDLSTRIVMKHYLPWLPYLKSSHETVIR